MSTSLFPLGFDQAALTKLEPLHVDERRAIRATFGEAVQQAIALASDLSEHFEDIEEDGETYPGSSPERRALAVLGLRLAKAAATMVGAIDLQVAIEDVERLFIAARSNLPPFAEAEKLARRVFYEGLRIREELEKIERRERREARRLERQREAVQAIGAAAHG